MKLNDMKTIFSISLKNIESGQSPSTSDDRRPLIEVITEYRSTLSSLINAVDRVMERYCGDEKDKNYIELIEKNVPEFKSEINSIINQEYDFEKEVTSDISNSKANSTTGIAAMINNMNIK